MFEEELKKLESFIGKKVSYKILTSSQIIMNQDYYKK